MYFESNIVSLILLCKQKTAYEMRISDWSTDVCSSDLPEGDAAQGAVAQDARLHGGVRQVDREAAAGAEAALAGLHHADDTAGHAADEDDLPHRTDRKSTRLNSSH